MREPAVAGQFYADSFDELEKQIKEAFLSKKGPGALPVSRKDKKIRGLIVPHAGYFFSGGCAAWGFKEIAEHVFPEAYVILGLNHSGVKSGISIEDWRTPFGVVKNHKDLSIALKENTYLEINESVHTHEHSIEVQVPFLQFVSKDQLAKLRIVPIAIGQDIEYRKLAKQISETLKGKDVVYIISSDFTHYGHNYRYVPFTLDVEKRLNDLDRGAIDKILAQDIQGFAEYINKTGITICGYMPILLFLSILRYEGYEKKGKLLMHYSSGDVLGDYKNSVSYASLVFS